MRLGWLELTDFRSYHQLRLEPDPTINIFVGPNGAGKSNLLEAVSYLARLRSFRKAPDIALIALEAASAVVRGEFTADATSALVEVELPRTGRRRVQLNGKRPKRNADLVTQVRMVVFLPDDLSLVKGPPAGRRDYLDDLAAQLWPTAAGEQADYEKALKQRNALLRNEGHAADASALDVWDQQIATVGAAIIARRLGLVDSLSPMLEASYAEISAGGTEVAWRYEAKVLGEVVPGRIPDDAAEQLLAGLAEQRRLDMDRKVTTVGPHRDDPALILGVGDARTLASQGEQRSLALALRLSSFDLITAETGEVPLLLLDDVFSELDHQRTAGVVARLPDAQVFITTARPEDVPVEGHHWSVSEGVVE